MLTVPPHLIGIPFLLGGRTSAGCDCWGLLWLAYGELLDISLPSLAPGDVDAVELAKTAWRQLPPGAEAAGDVLLFRVQGWPGHVGLAVGRRRMLHVSEGTTSRVERYDTPVWLPRLEGAYRHPQRWVPGR